MLRRANLSQLLDQITKMLEMTNAAKKNDSPLPPGIEERVSELERIVSEFCTLSERMFKSAGYQQGELESLVKESKGIEERDQRTLQRAAQLQQEAGKTYFNLSLAMQVAKTVGNLRSEDPKKRAQERQKRFGRVGGRKGWTPM